MTTRLLIVAFHEIVIKYESDLKTQLVLLDISMNHNVGLPRSYYFKFCQMIYLFNLLSVSATKWSNTLKQFVGNWPTNCLSVFNHFVRLALKGLKRLSCYERFLFMRLVT